MSSAIHKNGSDRCRHVPAIDQGALVIALNLNQSCDLLVNTIAFCNDGAISLTIESAVYYAQHLNVFSEKCDTRAFDAMNCYLRATLLSSSILHQIYVYFSCSK